MSDDQRPERIWLLHEMGDEGSDVWCDDPAPNHPTLDQPDSTEYVRADALDARDAEIKRLREALERRDDLLMRARSEIRTLLIEHQDVPEDEELLGDIQIEWRENPCDARTALQGGDDEG